MQVETINRFSQFYKVDKLLYSPSGKSVSYLLSRRYEFSLLGEIELGKQCLIEILVDPLSHIVSDSVGDLEKNWNYCLEYSLKDSVLDLEKQAILNYWNQLSEKSFDLSALKLLHRIYFFGNEVDQAIVSQVANAQCNSAIHHWAIIEAD